jgi:surfactin synthase thioesterase subunit
MWIRDALPKEFPTIRVHLFGYNTKLAKSNSFQTIPDLASFLAESLKASDLLSPAAKPLIFLAHSLGGIVLKEALDREHQKMRHVAGAVFFGVPSRGMETQALMTMVSGQPNGGLVRDLTTASDYLGRLDDRFFEVVRRGTLELFWAYETKTTPTVAVSMELCRLRSTR